MVKNLFLSGFLGSLIFSLFLVSSFSLDDLIGALTKFILFGTDSLLNFIVLSLTSEIN